MIVYMKVKDILHLFAESYPHAICLTDIDVDQPGGPTILYVNDKFSEMSGFSRSEIVGNNPAIFQGDKTNKTKLKQFVRKLKDGELSKTTVVNYRKNGEQYNCDICAYPLHDEKGNLVNFIAFEREYVRTPGRPKKNRNEEKWWLELG